MDFERYRGGWDDHIDRTYIDKLLAEAHERTGERWDIGKHLAEGYDRDHRPVLILRDLSI